MRLFRSRRLKSQTASGSPARIIEGLESRILFHLELIAPLANLAVAPGTAETDIDLTKNFDNEDINGTVVRFDTDLGNIDMLMFDSKAPVTVQNFLGYVLRGDYNNTYFHRSLPNFIVQVGVYSVSTLDAPGGPTHITTSAPIPNEFSPQRSNVRSTIAMAKITGDPNSATSEFFYNLEDNSSNLDNQNGGFTVFGQVINDTMKTVDAIAGLPTYKAAQGVPFESDFPLQGTPPATADNVVKIHTAKVVPETALYTYTLNSSDPSIVTPVVEDGVLKLLYAPGALGTAKITVTAFDVNSGATVTSDFEAGVGELSVGIGNGNGGAKAVTFTDADGTAATISLKGGAGTVHFSGSNLSQNTGKAGAAVQGSITDVSIDLTGTGSSGALTVKASGGDGRITVSHLTSDGGMKSIAAKQVNLAGNLTIAGNVSKADFADISNSTMTFGGAGGSLALTMLNADNVELDSQIAIKSLKAARFTGGGTGGGPDVGTINAPALASLTVTGDMGQRLNLAGTLGTTKIGGTVSTFLPWSVGGAAGKLTIAGFDPSFAGDFLGGIAALTVSSNLTGVINTTALKALSVKGDMDTVNLTLSGAGNALGKATISGAITNTRIQAANGIGSITAASMNASTIYAGVNTDGGILPTAPDDFTAGSSSILSVSLKGNSGTPTFVNSNIAARSLGKVSLGIVQTGNAGVPFGIAGDTIASVAGSGNGAIKLSKLADPSQSTTQDDFNIRVF
jgi:peptidyl-prolyl cis-trans isomerase A (cyclophilin A)